MPDIDGLLLYCRPGFEKEVAAEIQSITGAKGIHGFARATPDSGFAVFQPYGPPNALQQGQVRFDDLVFARQLVFLFQRDPARLPTDDRITPLLGMLRATDMSFSELRAETADTNDAKELSGFLRNFTPALESALRKAGILDWRAPQALHLFFEDSTTVLAGFSRAENASPWPLGIPRLRFPGAAPSR
ncbi:MAG: rRNA ((2498)-2-O)-methyltransferase RlmM [Moraxellaceae bacterium]|jgi:23S rRNA (cytidine2498-2'-O)-methyltransferase|nr:rRNA ((2498)-2-O)-methyltransferase RlmM [Moraxellaceae bacterium]